MNKKNHPQFKEDFDTRLRRAHDKNDLQVNAEMQEPSQNGKGLAFRIGTELVVAVCVGGLVGYLLDLWLNSIPWFLICFLLLGNAAGLWNIFRLTNNLGYSVGFRKEEIPEDKKELPHRTR